MELASGVSVYTLVTLMVDVRPCSHPPFQHTPCTAAHIQRRKCWASCKPRKHKLLVQWHLPGSGAAQGAQAELRHKNSTSLLHFLNIAA